MERNPNKAAAKKAGSKRKPVTRRTVDRKAKQKVDHTVGIMEQKFEAAAGTRAPVVMRTGTEERARILIRRHYRDRER